MGAFENEVARIETAKQADKQRRAQNLANARVALQSFYAEELEDSSALKQNGITVQMHQNRELEFLHSSGGVVMVSYDDLGSILIAGGQIGGYSMPNLRET